MDFSQPVTQQLTYKQYKHFKYNMELINMKMPFITNCKLFVKYILLESGTKVLHMFRKA